MVSSISLSNKHSYIAAGFGIVAVVIVIAASQGVNPPYRFSRVISKQARVLRSD